jgi:hypothetical protein
LNKANYGMDAATEFLDDLAVLCAKLGLIAVGLMPATDQFFSLAEMRQMVGSSATERLLQQLHVRVYTEADFEQRWNTYFSWPPALVASSRTDRTAALASMFRRIGGSKRNFAQKLQVDPSLLGKVLRGEKPCPEGWLTKATGLMGTESLPGVETDGSSLEVDGSLGQ